MFFNGLFKPKPTNSDFKKIKKRYSEEKGNVLDSLYYVWGVKAADESSPGEANFYTLNDLSLIYDERTGLFNLEVETSYLFNSLHKQDMYLKGLLEQFEKFVEEQGFIKERYIFQMSNCKISLISKSIPQLLAEFRVLVKGIIFEETNI